jgi:hypothetical protein
VRTRRKPEPGVIVLDLRPFWAAFRRIGEAYLSAGRAIRDAFDKRLQARRRAGGAGDPRSDDWQCGPCSGWLHGSCPGPVVDCRCTCQGGHLR